MFDSFTHNLGSLKTYKGSRVEGWNVSYNNSHKTGKARYVVDAEFEKGSAEIKVGLVLHDDQWQIESFWVNSEALMRD